jgi:hypothetical protein
LVESLNTSACCLVDLPQPVGWKGDCTLVTAGKA